MTPKYTIGYYDDSFHPGGTTRYLLTLAGALDRETFRPVLFAPERRPWHDAAEEAGMEVVTLRPQRPAAPPAASAGPPKPPSLKSWLAGSVRELAMLRKLFRMRRVDLLHSNNAGAEVAPIAARLAGAPIVIATWHVDSSYDLDHIRAGWNYRLLEMACMRSLHHAISVSRATARDWVRRCRLGDSAWRRITVIPNGIDVEKLRRRRSAAEAKAAQGLDGRLVIASMGRLEPAKGYEHLIRALPSVVERHPEALVRIAGRGPLLEPLRSLAAALGVADHVEFLGFTAAIQDFLEAADIYAQPSLCEAMPMAVLEASAIGLPVVAADVGGVAECVIDGKTGRVVPARDPAALANALAALAGDPPLRAALGAEAARLARESFTVGTMVARTEEVYRAALGGETRLPPC